MPIGAKTPVQNRMPMTGRPGNVHIAKSGAPQSRMPISGRLVPHARAAKPRNPMTPRPQHANLGVESWRRESWRMPHSNVRLRAVAVKGSVHNAKRGSSRLVNVHNGQGMRLELVHVAKTGGTSLEQWIKNATGYHRNQAMGRCLTRHNRSTQTGTHCLSNYARRYRETLTFCVLRDPVNRTLSAFMVRGSVSARKQQQQRPGPGGVPAVLRREALLRAAAVGPGPDGGGRADPAEPAGQRDARDAPAALGAAAHRQLCGRQVARGPEQARGALRALTRARRGRAGLVRVRVRVSQTSTLTLSLTLSLTKP